MQSKQSCRIQVEALRQEIARLEGTAQRQQATWIPSGLAALNRILPGRGFCTGTLVEWLAAGEGAGATTLALMAASQACRQGGGLVVVDGRGDFYPPAALRLGIEPARLIVVRTGNKADHHWALDQALRCPGVAAVLAWPESVEGIFDGRTFRRLQLAAEEGGSLGLLVRPQSVQGKPSWADVRLLVEPLPSTAAHGRARRLRILLLRSRGGGGRHVEVEIDDETHPVYMAAGA